MYRMLDVYTVAFFGHRHIDNFFKVEELLEEEIRRLINEKEYVDFLVGRNGDFDQIVASTVRRVKREFFDANSSLIWVMPYIMADFRENEEDFLRYYDEIEVCEKSAEAHFKGAIQTRNREMVGRADLIICYVEKSGGAEKTIKYAQKIGKKVINLYNLI